MNKPEWRIYVGRIPYNEKGNFWVSFESDQSLKKTKENIYGRCLPCIQGLYHQLKEGHNEIILGNSYNCWKVTAAVNGFEECLELLYKFERRFPGGHVYVKFLFGYIPRGSPRRILPFLVLIPRCLRRGSSFSIPKILQNETGFGKH